MAGQREQNIRATEGLGYRKPGYWIGEAVKRLFRPYYRFDDLFDLYSEWQSVLRKSMIKKAPLSDDEKHFYRWVWTKGNVNVPELQQFVRHMRLTGHEMDVWDKP